MLEFAAALAIVRLTRRAVARRRVRGWLPPTPERSTT